MTALRLLTFTKHQPHSGQSTLSTHIISLQYMWLISRVTKSNAGKDAKGNTIVKWAEHENLSLFYDAKDRFTFKLAIWKKEHIPDMSFVLNYNNDRSLE